MAKDPSGAQLYTGVYLGDRNCGSGDSTFGQVVKATDPRIMQAAITFNF